MTPENLLYTILAILAFNFLLGRIMQFLTAQSWKKASIPELRALRMHCCVAEAQR